MIYIIIRCLDQDNSTSGQLQSLQQMVLRQLDIHTQKHEAGLKLHTHTNSFKHQPDGRATQAKSYRNAGVNL